MKTEAQRERDARKRRKARAKARGESPNTWSFQISTFIWDGWNWNMCIGAMDTPVDFDNMCYKSPPSDRYVHSFWGFKTCEENMVSNHFRSIRSGWLFSTGFELSEHQMSALEAHGESVRHHKAFLQGDGRGAKLRFGWNPQTQRQFEVAPSTEGQGLFLRTELVVSRYGSQGGHVWQGMENLGIGVADVAAAISTLSQSLSRRVLMSLI